MKTRIISKNLAVAVLMLFVGVGIQPAIASVEPNTFDNDDCEVCPVIESISNLVDDEELIIDNILNNYQKNGFTKIICGILLLILQYYFIRMKFFFYVTAAPFAILLLLLSHLPFDKVYNLIEPLIITFINNRSYKINDKLMYFYNIAWELDCDYIEIPPPQILG
jgi:hypothetical protein